MSILIPDLILDSVSKIDIGLLSYLGIRGLILDVDNTLSPPHQKLPTSDIIQWFHLMHQGGIKMVIVSNNNRKRVAFFAKDLGIEYIPFGLKPLPFAVLTAVKRMGIAKSEAVVIGDQIFTDILAANLAGIKTILVNPIDKMESVILRFKRKLEKPVIRRYHKRSGK